MSLEELEVMLIALLHSQSTNRCLTSPQRLTPPTANHISPSPSPHSSSSPLSQHLISQAVVTMTTASVVSSPSRCHGNVVCVNVLLCRSWGPASQDAVARAPSVRHHPVTHPQAFPWPRLRPQQTTPHPQKLHPLSPQNRCPES